MRYLFLIIFTANCFGTFAQQDSFDILRIVYQLPELEDLLDTAIAQSNIMKAKQALFEIKEGELKKMKFDYLDMVSMQAGTSYGNAALSTMQTGFTDIMLSNSSSLRFSVGLNVNFSPSYWARRKQELNIKRSQLRYEKAMQQSAKTLIKGQIIEAYLNLEYYRDAYAVANASFESNESTVLLAEKKFLEGDIGIDIYNSIQLRHSKMSLEVQDLKRNLKQAYYQLEMVLGKPLHTFVN